MTVPMFQMLESQRQKIIADHQFYVEQAQTRLLSQFVNLDPAVEVEKVADEYLSENSSRFNPDRHDVADCHQDAYEEGCAHYHLLLEMHEATRLSVISSSFAQWEKELKNWIANEIGFWHQGPCVNSVIWKAEFPLIVSFLVAVGFNVRSLSCYAHLNAMRLVVNVFKHGNGKPLNDLKREFPEFIPEAIGSDNPERFPPYILDHTHMKVLDKHLEQFSDAIVGFWRAVPTEIRLSGNIAFPDRIEKAFENDLAQMGQSETKTTPATKGEAPYE